ncbi:hypothetical protein FF1_001875 [Malus domestica]
MASSTSSSSDLSSSVLPPSALPNVSNFLTIKLDRTNYPLWHAQILPLLRSRNLVPFVDGTSQCPSAFLTDTSGTLTNTVNPAFEGWMQQDAMVLSWINSSVHPTVLASLIGKTSSHSAWTSLRERYASTSTGRLLQLRSDLMNTHRGDSSIADFLDRVNSLADTLSLSGSPISDSDLVAIVLNNVGPAYESTVSSAQAREDAISYDALEALLLGAERRQKMSHVLHLDAAPTVLAAGRGGRDFQVGNGRGFQPAGRGFQAAVGRGGRGGRGVFRQPGAHAPNDGVLGAGPQHENSFHPNGRVQCQICRKPGHSAINCYNRMNMAYEGRVPAPKLQVFAANAHAHAPPPMTAPQVQNWLFDSGANAHITNDLAQVAEPRDYNGNNHVNGVVGGTGPNHREDPFARPE